MFSNFVTAFNTVLPLCMLIALGFFLRQKGKIGNLTQKESNEVVFKALLPFLIFKNIFYTNFKTDFNLRLIIFSIGIIFLQYIIATVLAFSIEKKDSKTKGALIHTVFRTNSLIYGMAILINLYGNNRLGSASVAMALTLPFTNTLAVFTLEKFRGGKMSYKNLLIGVAKNPIIVATFIALLLRAVGIDNFPGFINMSIATLAELTSPMALLFLGASIEPSKIKDNVRNLVYGITTKLIVSPAIVIALAVYMGFRGVDLAAIMCITGGPTAVTAYSMAASMDSNADLTAEMVTFTTFLSCGTIFCWIFILMQMGML